MSVRGWWLSSEICGSTIVFSDVKLSFKPGFYREPFPPAARWQTSCRVQPSQPEHPEASLTSAWQAASGTLRTEKNTFVLNCFSL